MMWYRFMMWLGLREYDRGYEQAQRDMLVMPRDELHQMWLTCEMDEPYDRRGYKRALMGWEK